MDFSFRSRVRDILWDTIPSYSFIIPSRYNEYAPTHKLGSLHLDVINTYTIFQTKLIQ